VNRERHTPRNAKPGNGQRFLRLAEVAEVLNISGSQTYALVRSGDLIAIKIGGRGQWRVEALELEKYIERMYVDARRFVSSHPLGAESDEAVSLDD
jgi:excisionase family DNA binding protein